MGLVTERLAIVITSTGGQAVGDVKKLDSAFGGFTKTQAAAGAAALVVGKQLLDAAHAASNLGEQVSASNVIFGQGAPQVQAFAKTAVDSFGLSERAALEAANSFASLFKNAGLNDADVGRFSTTLTKLGADISSLRNVAQSDVLGALRSGLTGEVEPLRRLGIILNDTTVSARAVQMGLADANGTVEDGAKVLARLNLILEQTGDAQGDFARTGDSAANAQRRMSAEWENFQATVGKTVLPLLAETTGSLSDLLSAANGLLAPLGGLGSVAKILGRGMTDLILPLGMIGRLFGDHKSATEKAAEAQRQYADDAAASSKVQREQAAATDAQTKALERSKKALDDASNAQERATDTHRAAEMAVRNEAKAQKDLDDLVARGRVDQEAVARAKDRLTDASKAATKAQEDEADASNRVALATANVADAQAAVERVKKGASARDLAKADLANAAAQRARERASIGLSKAQEDLNSGVQVGLVAAGQHVTTARDQREAELDLADALDDVKLADIHAQEEQENLQKVRDQGKPGSDDLKDALDVLKAKTDDLNTAVKDQATAHQNVAIRQGEQIKAGEDLRKAEAGDPEFDEKLRDARQKVADAYYDAGKAKRDERDATNELNAAEATLANDRRVRKAEQDQMFADVKAALEAGGGGRGGTAGPGTGTGPGNNPLGALAGLSAAQQGVMGGLAPTTTPTFGEQPWQRQQSTTSVVIYTGADPNAVARAIEQNKANNGGKPRGGP